MDSKQKFDRTPDKQLVAEILRRFTEGTDAARRHASAAQRQRLFLALMTGVRAGELAQLRFGDLDAARVSLRVQRLRKR